MKSKGITLLLVVGFLFVALSLSARVAEDDRGGMPDSHRTGWLEKHQAVAKGNTAECSMCHKPVFCVECHQKRDTISENVHKRNWKFFHSIEARANPRKCDSCHKPVFCTTCHQNPR